MTDWCRACSINDVKEGEPLGLQLAGQQVGVFCVGDRYYALEDICPHGFAMLSSGYQEADTIECPLHQAVFSIPTGEHLSPPAQCGVKSYPVKIEGEAILVDISGVG